jgi:hypothetical protein
MLISCFKDSAYCCLALAFGDRNLDYSNIGLVNIRRDCLCHLWIQRGQPKEGRTQYLIAESWARVTIFLRGSRAASNLPRIPFRRLPHRSTVHAMLSIGDTLDFETVCLHTYVCTAFIKSSTNFAYKRLHFSRVTRARFDFVYLGSTVIWGSRSDL